eukprot:1149658-Pelagomonas_calceolata.AAC.3
MPAIRPCALRKSPPTVIKLGSAPHATAQAPMQRALALYYPLWGTSRSTTWTASLSSRCTLMQACKAAHNKAVLAKPALATADVNAMQILIVCNPGPATNQVSASTAGMKGHIKLENREKKDYATQKAACVKERMPSLTPDVLLKTQAGPGS